jgi:hypothetical protein
MSRIPLKLFVVVALAVAVGLATAVSPFAASSPDGLNRVAEDKGFAEAEAPGGFQQDGSPIADYAFPGVGNERLATGLAGVTGTLVLFAVGFGLARLLQRGQRQRQEQTPPARA